MESINASHEGDLRAALNLFLATIKGQDFDHQTAGNGRQVAETLVASLPAGEVPAMTFAAAAVRIIAALPHSGESRDSICLVFDEAGIPRIRWSPGFLRGDDGMAVITLEGPNSEGRARLTLNGQVPEGGNRGPIAARAAEIADANEAIGDAREILIAGDLRVA